MLEISGRALFFAGLATLAFMGYCIYFDHKRRRDPEYRRRVHERRITDRHLEEDDEEVSHPCQCKAPLCAEVVEYFLRHVYLGEMNIRRDDCEKAVHHFANAIMVCADPNILLYKLQKIVSKDLYEQIVTRVRLLMNTTDQWTNSLTESDETSPEWTIELTDSYVDDD